MVCSHDSKYRLALLSYAVKGLSGQALLDTNILNISKITLPFLYTLTIVIRFNRKIYIYGEYFFLSIMVRNPQNPP